MKGSHRRREGETGVRGDEGKWRGRLRKRRGNEITCGIK